MKAIVQSGYGTADQWRTTDIPKPQIADTEVLVKVHAAGLDRGTWHAMTGLPYLGRLYFGLLPHGVQEGAGPVPPTVR